jgi:hypothetical protein
MLLLFCGYVASMSDPANQQAFTRATSIRRRGVENQIPPV